MASVNKVILVGNLGRDPEMRYSPNGGAICNITVATSRVRKDRDTGERREDTEWHRVVLFDRSGIHNIWTFHSAEYLAARWGRIFEIERVIERGHGMHQDAILLRKS